MEIRFDTGPATVKNPTGDEAFVIAGAITLSSVILVVDDEIVIRELIKAHLEAAGYVNIEMAEDGISGLDRILTDRPDLVILDIEMPGLNGIEVLTKVRANPDFEDMPIIVGTGHDQTAFRNEVLRAGATNIISKPIDFELLLHRVKTHLEYRFLLKSLKAYQLRIQQELEAARSMQMQLLPRGREIVELEQHYGVKLDWHYKPSSELSGDCWGIQAIDDHKFAVFVVDFTGHGVGSAVNTFRLHTVMKDIATDSESPARYLEALNVQLTDLIPRGQFATMNYAIIDVKGNRLTYASAGHTSPIIGDARTRELTVGDPSGLPLGISKSATYTDHELALNPGDFLFQYSDALIETPGDTSPPLEEEGLVDLVDKAFTKAESTGALKWLLETFYGLSDIPPSDDVTAVWLQRLK